MGVDAGLVDGGERVEAAVDDDAGSAVRDGDLEERAVGLADGQDAAEAERVESGREAPHPGQRDGGHLAEAGGDDAVAALDDLADAGHAAADEDLEGVEARSAVVDHLGEPHGLAVADLEQAAETRRGGDALAQQHAVDGHAAHGADGEAVGGHGQAAQAAAGPPDGDVTPHAQAGVVDRDDLAHGVARALDGDGRDVEDDGSFPAAGLEGHLVGQLVDLRGDEAHFVGDEGVGDLLFAQGGDLAAPLAATAGQALGVHHREVVAHRALADVDAHGLEFARQAAGAQWPAGVVQGAQDGHGPLLRSRVHGGISCCQPPMLACSGAESRPSSAWLPQIASAVGGGSGAERRRMERQSLPSLARSKRKASYAWSDATYCKIACYGDSLQGQYARRCDYRAELIDSSASRFVPHFVLDFRQGAWIIGQDLPSSAGANRGDSWSRPWSERAGSRLGTPTGRGRCAAWPGVQGRMD